MPHVTAAVSARSVYTIQPGMHPVLSPACPAVPLCLGVVVVVAIGVGGGGYEQLWLTFQIFTSLWRGQSFQCHFWPAVAEIASLCLIMVRKVYYTSHWAVKKI